MAGETSVVKWVQRQSLLMLQQDLGLEPEVLRVPMQLNFVMTLFLKQTQVSKLDLYRQLL